MHYGKLATSIILLLLCLFVLYFLKIRARRSHRIARTPVSPIGELKPGLVKIVGKVALEKVHLSPVTGVKSAFNRCTVQQKHYASSTLPRVILTRDSENYMLLEDPSGKVKVFLDGSEVILRPTYEQSTHVLESIPPHLLKFLGENGVDPQNSLGVNKHLIFTEYVVHPGQPILVIGNVADEKEEHDSGDVHIIRKRENDDLLHVTDKSESKLRGDYDMLLILVSMAVFLLFTASISIWLF